MSVSYVDINVVLDREQLARVTEAAALRGETVEAFVVAAVTEYAQRPRSRNLREGRFVGHVGRKAVRRRKPVPALYEGDIELLPERPPYVDSAIAWLTLSKRRSLPLPEQRYLAKAHRGQT
jgi:hypothetical protein